MERGLGGWDTQKGSTRNCVQQRLVDLSNGAHCYRWWLSTVHLMETLAIVQLRRDQPFTPYSWLPLVTTERKHSQLRSFKTWSTRHPVLLGTVDGIQLCTWTKHSQSHLIKAWWTCQTALIAYTNDCRLDIWAPLLHRKGSTRDCVRSRLDQSIILTHCYRWWSQKGDSQLRPKSSIDLSDDVHCYRWRFRIGYWMKALAIALNQWSTARVLCYRWWRSNAYLRTTASAERTDPWPSHSSSDCRWKEMWMDIRHLGWCKLPSLNQKKIRRFCSVPSLCSRYMIYDHEDKSPQVHGKNNWRHLSIVWIRLGSTGIALQAQCRWQGITSLINTWRIHPSLISIRTFWTHLKHCFSRVRICKRGRDVRRCRMSGI